MSLSSQFFRSLLTSSLLLLTLSPCVFCVGADTRALTFIGLDGFTFLIVLKPF